MASPYGAFAQSLPIVVALFATSLTAEGQTTLESIIDNVKANEALYANFDTEAVLTFTLGESEGKEPAYMISRSEAIVQSVVQNGRTYFRRSEETRDKGDQRHVYGRLEGFDGKTTRVVARHESVGETGVVANIIDGRAPQQAQLHAHSLMLRQTANVDFPLSAYLSGTKSVKSYSSYKNFNVTVEVVGRENVEGLDCWKLRIFTWSDGAKPSSGDTRLLWLAIEKNYLPVRTEGYSPRANGKLVEKGTVDGFTELSTGIWFPMNIEIKGFDEPALIHGRELVRNIYRIRVSKVDLHPNYEEAFFSNIEIPQGAVVYKVKNQQILGSYVERANAARGRGVRTYIIVFNVAVVAIIIAWFIVRAKVREKDNQIETATGDM
jgi:hypothetical protein